ncbi:MAG: hypothetical protein H0U76_01050 [Ktedonobacteraceae bacterium]|nr:hypothetical protein [Ktedonobacteraceae bacterium]
MQEAILPLLKYWESFYVIMGAAAGTLIGLTFVVISLVRDVQQQQGNDATIAAFSTPTVVHFCAVLLITAILSAPWPMLWLPGLLLGIAGLAGIGYVLIILRRTRRQSAYQPVLEDWVWHVIFPFVAYSALVVATIVLPSNPVTTLFIVGAATILLLFIGIHNSWDAVTYLIIQDFQPESKSQNQTGE